MYRPKNCTNCGKNKYQQGGNNLLPLLNPQMINEAMIDRPLPDAETPSVQMSPFQELISKGVIEAPQGWEGTAQQYYDHVNTPQKKDKIKDLQRLGIGLQGARTGLSWLAGAVERNRQNQFDMTQQTALGMMNPMQVDDFQPNPYNLYMMKGGKLTNIVKDYNKWSNDAKMDFGSGDDDKGMMQKGGSRKPTKLNTDVSLTDYMRSVGINSSFETRSYLFDEMFKEPYKGTAEQNIYILNKFKSGEIPVGEVQRLLHEEGEKAYFELPKNDEMQKGGRAPIYTNDLNDPRLRAYQDSLNAYKTWKKLDEMDATIPNWPDGLDLIRANNDFSGEKAAKAPYEIEYNNGIKMGYYRHSKPVQPYKYVKEEQPPKFKPIINPPFQGKDMSTGPNPQVTAPNLQRADWDMSKPSNWSITSPTGPYNEQETINLPDEATWRAALEGYKNISTQQMDGKGTATGDKKMKKGGYEIDRMLVVRKLLPELLNLGRLGTRKYRGHGMKKGGTLSPNKAREILHDGTAHGKPLTDKQRKFFGAKSKGHTNYRGK